jgi:hypothetical protein
MNANRYRDGLGRARLVGRLGFVAAVGALALLLGTAALPADPATAATARPAIWLSDWYPAAIQTCGDGVCSSGVPDVAYPGLQVNGEAFTEGGQVEIGVFQPWESVASNAYYVTATYHAGFDLGSFGYRTDLGDCDGLDIGYNVEIQAYDFASGNWSNPIAIRVCGGSVG